MNSKAHLIYKTKNEDQPNLMKETFDINAICPMQDHVVATGGDDGLIKLWDKRIMSCNCSKAVLGFIGHHEGILSLDSTYKNGLNN